MIQDCQQLDVARKPASSRRGALVLVPLLFMLVLWVWFALSPTIFRQGPDGVLFGDSFGTYLSGAQTLHDGSNPYDPRQLLATEQRLLGHQHVPVQQPLWNSELGNPPLFIWMLQPLARFPYRTVAWAWIGGVFALSLAGFIAALANLRWTHKALPTLIFAMMPQNVYGAYYGEVYSVALAACAGALLLGRRYPFAAGCLLVLTWIKPTALPFALLVILFHTVSRPRAAAGFLSATCAFWIVSLLGPGEQSIGEWLNSLRYYSGHTAVHPHLATLVGLYVRWAPAPLFSALELSVIALVALATLGCLYRFRHTSLVPLQYTAWLWLAWFLALPFAHFYDEVILAIPVLVLFGPNGVRVGYPMPALALYVLFGSLFISNQTPHGIYLLSFPLLVIGGLLLTTRSATRTGSVAFP